MKELIQIMRDECPDSLLGESASQFVMKMVVMNMEITNKEEDQDLHELISDRFEITKALLDSGVADVNHRVSFSATRHGDVVMTHGTALHSVVNVGLTAVRKIEFVKLLVQSHGMMVVFMPSNLISRSRFTSLNLLMLCACIPFRL